MIINMLFHFIIVGQFVLVFHFISIKCSQFFHIMSESSECTDTFRKTIFSILNIGLLFSGPCYVFISLKQISFMKPNKKTPKPTLIHLNKSNFPCLNLNKFTSKFSTCYIKKRSWKKKKTFRAMFIVSQYFSILWRLDAVKCYFELGNILRPMKQKTLDLYAWTKAVPAAT